MTSSLVERSREDTPPTRKHHVSVLEEDPPGGAFGEALSAIRFRTEQNLSIASRLAGAVPGGIGRLVRDPMGTVADARNLVGSLRRLLQPISQPMSPLMTGRSTSVHFDVLELPLKDLKRSARAVRGTLNDAFVAAIAGGLRIYHERHGQPVEELRMTMPVNLRDEDEKGKQAGNQFAPARFAIPVGVVDPRARMRELHRRVIEQRSEPALPMSEDVASVLTRLPRSLSVGFLGSMLKAIDLVTSNVPGPPFTVYASGAKVESMVGFGPLSGSALNVTLFSYDGAIRMGINSDPAAVPDPDVLVECLQKGLDEVLSVA
jgi:WS/DGAT/MGAT family acyltransferase